MGFSQLVSAAVKVLAHDMAVDTGIRIVGQVRSALREVKGVSACARQDPE
jgi:hypothetical protein